MDNVAGSAVKSDSAPLGLTEQEQLVQKGIRGKLTRKNVSLFHKDWDILRVLLYIFSYLIKVLSHLAIKLMNMRKEKKIYRPVIWVIFYARRFHVVIFNLVLGGLYFLGIRTIFHTQFSNLSTNEKAKYFIVIVGLCCSLIDIYNILSSCYNIVNIKPVLPDNIEQEKPKGKNRVKKMEKNNKNNKIDYAKLRESQATSASPTLRLPSPSPPTTDNNPNHKPVLVIDHEKTLKAIMVDKPVRNHLLATLKESNSKVPRVMNFMSFFFLIKLIFFQAAIVTLQQLPTICLLVMMAAEALFGGVYIYALFNFKHVKSWILVASKAVGSGIMMFFLVFFLGSFTFGDEEPTESQQSFMIGVYVTIILFEFGYLIIANIIMFKVLIYFICNKAKGKGSQKIPIIFYKEEKLEAKNMVKKDSEDMTTIQQLLSPKNMPTDSSPRNNLRSKARRSKRQLSNISDNEESSEKEKKLKKPRKSVYKPSSKMKIK